MTRSAGGRLTCCSCPTAPCSYLMSNSAPSIASPMRGECQKHSSAGVFAALTLLLLHSNASTQQPPPATVAVCNACHGPGGNSQIPLTPSLAGQPKLFIENQLVLIREGLRDVPQMKEIVVGMTDETIIALAQDRKSTRLNSSHLVISYAVFCLKKKN